MFWVYGDRETAREMEKWKVSVIEGLSPCMSTHVRRDEAKGRLV